MPYYTPTFKNKKFWWTCRDSLEPAGGKPPSVYGRTMEVFFLIHLVSYMQIGAFFGVILYLLVLVVYWQIISCLIVYTYDLIRGKKEFRKEILIFLIIFITIFSISII